MRKRKVVSKRSQEGKNVKVRKFERHSLNRMNLGIPVFGFIFVYIIIMIIMASRKTTIAGYEVKLGTLAKNTTGRAVAIREEMVVMLISIPTKTRGFLKALSSIP